MSIYAIIVMAFINGNLVDDPVFLMSDDTHQLTEKSCSTFAHQVLDHVRQAATPDIQFVTKCVDLEKLPLTASAFGSQSKAK